MAGLPDLASLVAIVFGMSLDGIFLTNLFMLQAWVPVWRWYFSYSAPSWSISVEMAFYLLFPLLILGWPKTWWWKLVLSAALVVVLMVLGTWLGLPSGRSPKPIPTLHGLLYVNPLARVLEFVLGIAACSVFLWLRRRIVGLNLMGFTVIELAALAIGAYFVAFNPALSIAVAAFGRGAWSDWLLHTGGTPAFAGVIIIFALGRGIVSRLLTLPILIILGEMSYSVYLIHQTMFRAYESWFGAQPSPIVAFAACVAATLVFSFLVWRFVEVPCRDFVKRLVAGKESAETIPAASAA